MHVAAALGQRYTVNTIDQSLYCQLAELKWAFPEYQEKVGVQLGGLHTSMCFLATIGDHMGGTGLLEAWVESGLLGQNEVESGLLGQNAAEKVMKARHTKRQCARTN